jgi:hypothetical protein
MMFASSGGSGRGGGYDDDDYGYEDEFIDEPMEEPEPEEPRRRPRSTRTVRSGGPAAGNTRVAQHQPEERYWTDYLRIALPVVGLLLMIGLLWFWATQLIGDSPDTTDPETEEIGLVSQGTPEPTNEPAQVQGETTVPQNNTIGIGDAPSTPETTTGDTTGTGEEPATSDNQAEQPADAPADDTAPETDTGALFTDGDAVVITEDGVNVRPDATLAGEPVDMLDAGQELLIAGGPVEAEGYVWWQVILPDGSAGWVVQDYIEAAE